MSAADIDLVREAFDAYERAGVEALAQYFHPDFEGVVPPELSAEPDTYRGREGLRRYFALWEEQISDLGVAVEQLIDNDDAIVVLARLSGRGRGSGVPVELPAATRVTVRDGLIATWTAYPTLEDALAA
ncbi:MAG: nuclear transport factor 2 family protein [Solirubrobacteraceae bacterium]|jgi:ketosteroid isomerase-like protein